MPTDELASAEGTLAVLQQVLRDIARDDLAKQTPCREYNVAQLSDHLLNSIQVIGGAVGAQYPDPDPADAPTHQVLAAARPALDAWHRHGLAGTVTAGANEVPATMLAGILSLEFLVHAWDYATATGRAVAAPDELAEYVLGLTQSIITPQGRTTVGFDPPVDVPADASALDRLIAFTGRNPTVAR